MNDNPQPDQDATQPTPGKKQGNKKPLPNVVVVAPVAEPAKLRPRHFGTALSFLALVIIPLIMCIWYLWSRAEDQYATSIAFTIRQERGASAAEMLGAFAQLSGGSTQSDTDVLYEYLQTPQMVIKIDEEFDLVARYGKHYKTDPLFSLAPDATLPDKVDYWKRIAKVSYDQSTGIMEIEVLAFDPLTAKEIAASIIRHSQTLMNELNETTRADSLRFAEQDLALSVDRIKDAREKLIVFRTQNEIVDLDADLEGRLGVVNMLQQQLAEALIDLDLLTLTTSEADPRYVQTKNRTEVIRNRIEAERALVVSQAATGTSQDYPTLVADYESLVVDREYAERSYLAALSALDAARAEAGRQSSYLAPFLQPILAESAEYPRRLIILGLFAFFATLLWSILVLIYYSIRDSR